MLVTLELKDFAIVDEIRLDLAPGLNALTGETGAGKSLLVDALSLLVGQRADTTMIRQGSDSALVQGIFAGQSIASASRRLQLGGRSSARIDGELVTVAELADRVGGIVAVHGQHSALQLARREEPGNRLDRLLDDAGQELLRRYRELFREFRHSRRELEELLGSARERERRRDVLAYEIAEIEAARLGPDEDVRLRERLTALRNAERIAQATARALAATGEGESSAVALLDAAGRDLESAARYEPTLAPLVAELKDARAAAQAIAAELESFLDDFVAQPGELDRVESRLARIELLERKYGDGAAAILAYREQAAQELARLEGTEQDLASLAQRVERLRSGVAELGAGLTRAREAASERLSEEVRALLAQLGMREARLRVRFEALAEPEPNGLERPWFEFGANPGEGLADLADVASGGELSRVMLALDLITGADRPVLVFDEIDAGVGGEAARAIGLLLRRLARDRQVLVVTHLPQVAAYADAQFFVSKVSEGGRTVTRVRRLDSHEREHELARMLSGAVTEASLRNARELVSDATLPGG